MGAHRSHQSATIIPFPPRGRYLASDQREEPKPPAEATPPRVLGDVFDSGWYHDAAIQESKRTGDQ
jgi:hypothetical protein